MVKAREASRVPAASTARASSVPGAYGTLTVTVKPVSREMGAQPAVRFLPLSARTTHAARLE